MRRSTIRVWGALLLLATAAAAQPSPSEQLAEAKKLSAALQKEDLTEAQTLQPGVAPADRDAWKTAVQERIAVLQDAVELGRRTARWNIQGDAAAREREQLDAQIREIEARGDPELPPYSDEETATEAGRALEKATKVREAKSTELANHKADVAPYTAALRERTERGKRLQAALDKLLPEADTPLGKYRVETAQGRLAHHNLAVAFAERGQVLGPLLEARTRLATLEQEYAAKRANLIREEVKKTLGEQWQRQLDAARKALRRANALEDSVAAARATLEARLAEWQAFVTRDRRFLADLQSRLTTRKSASESWQNQRGIVVGLLERRGAFSTGVGDFLDRTLNRIDRERTELRDRAMPQVSDELDLYQNARAEVQDQLWELRSPVERRREYERLSEAHPDRTEDLKRALRHREAKRKEVLRQRSTQLAEIDARLTELSQAYGESLKTLNALRSFVVGRMFWVRNESALGMQTLRGAKDELADLVDTIGGSKVADALSEEYGQRPALLLGSAVGFLALVGLGLLLMIRLRRLDRRWGYPGGPVLQLLQRIGAALLISALAPMCFLGAAFLLGNLNLPERLHAIVSTAMVGTAIVLFFRRFCWVTFRPGGIAIRELKIQEGVAEQMLRATRRAFRVALALYVPWLILHHDLGYTHLPRVLYTLLLVAIAVIVGRMVRRKGALVSLLTHKTGFWYRAWFILGPAIRVTLIAIIVMDVAGYRIGARLLIQNILFTLGAALVLAGVYRLLTEMIERGARAVGFRVSEDKEETADPSVVSGKVFDQLTRFVGAILVTVVVIVLANVWGVSDDVQGFFEGMQIATVDAEAGVYLTAWSLLIALVWILVTHFILRNLRSLYEAILFPRLKNADAGVRYVILTFSRYLIAVVGYCAAILSLHFSFSSLGWILAAASVGLGFGLQEIVANFISGLILLVERPISVGDIISVGNTAGTVDEINIRATVVTNWDRQQIIVPNKNFITQEVKNWTRNDEVLRRVIPIGIAYGADVGKAITSIQEILEAHPAVLDEPGPSVIFTGFGASSLDLAARFFTKISDGLGTQDEILRTINQRFEEEEIEIPFPQQDLHLRTVDPDVGAAAKKAVQTAVKTAPAATPQAEPEDDREAKKRKMTGAEDAGGEADAP